MSDRPPLAPLVGGLRQDVPFVAPETLERRLGAPLRLRLGANESVFGISPRAREAMRSALDRIAWYAEPEHAELRAELACLHGVTLEHVVVASGIDDLLGLAARAFVEPGVRVVVSRGSYPTFQYHVRGFGGELHAVPYRDDRNDLEALAAVARRTRARIVYLANPDNPTGTFFAAGALRALLDGLPATCALFLDEAYADFATPEALLPVACDDPRLVRFRTFSKAHGMAGARIGYVLAPPETTRGMNAVRVQFGVNLVAQAGALASLRDPDFVRGVAREVAEGRRDYEHMACELGLRPVPSSANFVAIDVGDAARARRIVDDLLERRVFIRMPGAPPIDRCIRVTVGTPRERAVFAEELAQVVARNPAPGA